METYWLFIEQRMEDVFVIWILSVPLYKYNIIIYLFFDPGSKYCLLHTQHSEVKGQFQLQNSTSAVSDSCSRALQHCKLNLCILFGGQSPHSLRKPAVIMTKFDKACCAGASLFL